MVCLRNICINTLHKGDDDDDDDDNNNNNNIRKKSNGKQEFCSVSINHSARGPLVERYGIVLENAMKMK